MPNAENKTLAMFPGCLRGSRKNVKVLFSALYYAFMDKTHADYDPFQLLSNP